MRVVREDGGRVGGLEAAWLITMVHSRLRAGGWVQQKVAGVPVSLWRHAWKAEGREVTTMQACQVNDDEHEPPIWRLIQLG